MWPTKRLATADAGRHGADHLWRLGRRGPAGSAASSMISASRADGRVATFAWNSARHLELYFAAPCTGRVLHTLNIRLFADQLVYIVNHAEDEVVFVDRSLLPLLWPHIDECKTVRQVVVMDDCGGQPGRRRDPRRRPDSGLRGAAGRRRPRIPSTDVTDENRAASMCYTSGTTG